MRVVHLLTIPLFAALMLFLSPAQAQQAAYVLKIASVAPDGSPWAEGLKEFKGQAEKLAGGKLQVKLFIGGVLGDENETVLQTQRGQIQGVGASTGALASLVPDLSVMELPFLFNNAKEADHVLDNVVFKSSEAAFQSKGLVLGFWSENGFRCFGSSYGPIKTPADMKGRKMRSQENPVHIEMYKAFGATPVPIPTTEVLTSLQTGVVEGYDNTPLFAFAAQWTSGTKYFSVTRHMYQPAAIVYNKTWFDALPADVKTALLSARVVQPGQTVPLTQKLRDEIRAMDPILLENLKSMKIQVYQPTSADLAAFQGPAKVARDSYMSTKASSGEKAMYAQIDAGLKAYRSSH
ncbi:MAG TPA: TRAP transporter substrate-binding protein DctP [Myxococcota bacterium]|nr:TRAP transporter substrate-binding protein DctP [Myxococcota bacterium]